MKKMFALLVLLTLCSCGAKAEQAEEIRTANFAAETTTVENKEFEKEFKSYCQTVNYTDLTDSPTAYKGSNLMFTGKVTQVVEAERPFYRMDVTKTSYGYDDMIIFFCDDDTIKKDDIITIYGTGEGFYTYKGALGQDVTKPSVKVMFVSNHGQE